jgi:hypothetical protein
MASEPEPTALAAIALGDRKARRWLSANQRPDGSLDLQIGGVVNDSATSLAAIALPPGDARERALDHVVSSRGSHFRSDPLVPHDADTKGWAWTEGTFGWVEPTSRALLALRLLRPSATEAVADAVATLRDRETDGGGWNSGNREAFGVGLWPYGQTTAMALIALRDLDAGLERRGVTALRELWRSERDGPLTLSTATVALRVHGDPDWTVAAGALARFFRAGSFGDDVVSLAWAAIGTGPGIRSLTVKP